MLLAWADGQAGQEFTARPRGGCPAVEVSGHPPDVN